MAARTPWTPPLETSWDDALNAGFTFHFHEPLMHWFGAFLNPSILTIAGLRARVAWNHSPLWNYNHKYFATALFGGGDDQILIAIDAALYELAGKRVAARDALSRMLEAGGSAWRVREDGCGLERRVPESVRAAVAGAISSARGASADPP